MIRPRLFRLALLSLPAVVYLGMLVVPMIILGRMSLNQYTRTTGIRPATTLDNYKTALTDSFYVSTYLTTLRLAFITAIVCTIVGCVVGYLVWRLGGNYRRIVLTLVLLPMLISSVVRGYGLVGSTGPKGFLDWVSTSLGMGSLDIYGSEFAVMMGFTNVLMGFSVLLVVTSLDNIGRSVMRAATNLGATEWQRFRMVVAPLSYHGILGSMLFVFALAGAEYSIPAILGGRRILTTSILIYREQVVTFNWPLAAALSLTLVVIVMFLMLMYQGVLAQRGRIFRRRARES